VQAARRFLVAYIAFTDRGDSRGLRSSPATPALIDELVAAPPIVPPVLAGRAVRIASTTVTWLSHDTASVLFEVADGSAAYPVVVTVAGGWDTGVVTALEP
jgi:hypothetical protein